MVRIILSVLILWLLGPISISYGSPFPKSSAVQNLGVGLSRAMFKKNNNEKFEGNGAAYDSKNNKLWVLSTGYLLRMNLDGTSVESWDLGSEDQESITLRYIKGKSQPLIYVGLEYSENSKGAVILEFDVEKSNGLGGYTGKLWNLNSVLPVSDSKNGMEAMTFIPDGNHPCNHGKAASGSGGVFAISTQDSQTILFVDLKLKRSNRISKTCGTLNTGTYDNSDLYFDEPTKKLYAIFDKSDKLQIFSLGINPKFDLEMDLPNLNLGDLDGQEGFTLVSNCSNQTADVVITHDVNGLSQNILKYSGFPIECK